MTLTQLRYVIAAADTGSMNEAAKKLFISQPSLSQALRELEKEIGIEIFLRNNRGVILTEEGKEFLGYARQVTEQYELMESRYVEKKDVKKKFAVSMQHYTFAVSAFIGMVKQFGMEFNKRVLYKLFSTMDLEFELLMDCGVYVYMWKGHPLAGRTRISMEDLEPYPCLSFEQGQYNSFYFAEEVLSTYDYKRSIKVSDRATILNLMVGLCGYTLCSGIICEELNGSDYCAVLLEGEETMTIGYLKRKGAALSPLGQKYLEELEKVLV